MSDAPSYTARRMWPARRTDAPRWEVSVSGHIVGWVQEKRIGRASEPFFEAIGRLPWGELVSLGSATDRDEQCREVAHFAADPMHFERHLFTSQIRRLTESRP